MTLHIHWTEPLEEVVREDIGERWCFRCRKRREFQYVVKAPVDIMSYYGPSPSITCGTCTTIDSDLFPGMQREWSD